MQKNKETSLTLLSVLIGIAGAIPVAASSFYIVLKFGALPWPTIMVTLISISLLKLFKRNNMKEITVTHTIMSAGSMVAGGVAFTLPGYLLSGGNLKDIDKMPRPCRWQQQIPLPPKGRLNGIINIGIS